MLEVVVGRKPFSLVGHTQPIAHPVVAEVRCVASPGVLRDIGQKLVHDQANRLYPRRGTLSSSSETAISAPSTGESSAQRRLRKPTHETLSLASLASV